MSETKATHSLGDLSLLVSIWQVHKLTKGIILVCARHATEGTHLVQLIIVVSMGIGALWGCCIACHGGLHTVHVIIAIN